MLEKVWKCDLCHGIIDGEDDDACRIKWLGGIPSFHLTSMEGVASEDAICGQCIIALKKALAS